MSFNNVFQIAVRKQDVTNPVSPFAGLPIINFRNIIKRVYTKETMSVMQRLKDMC
jgi:hypothetical protein